MSFAIHFVFSTSINHCHRHRSELGLAVLGDWQKISRESPIAFACKWLLTWLSWIYRELSG